MAIDRMERVRNPAKLWRAFYDAYGPVVMLQAFGWTDAASGLHDKGERVYEFFAGHERIGWAAVIPHTNGIEWYLSRGVWPKHQGHGYAQRIGDLMVDLAFKELGALAVTVEVYDTNRKHLARMKRLARGLRRPEDALWRPSGRVTLPKPGHWRFTRLKPEAKP